MAFNQNPKKFLDSAGVSTLWSRINAQLVERDKNIAANAYGRRKSCGSLPDGTKLVWEFIDEDDSEVSE